VCERPDEEAHRDDRAGPDLSHVRRPGDGVRAGRSGHQGRGPELQRDVGLPEKFTLTQADDQFAPDKALTATQQLIQQDNVAALTTTIGTPSVIAVRDLLNTSCVPLIGASAGGAVANQPGKFPWTVAWTLPSALDARVWVQRIADKYPSGTKVGMFYANDASGKEFLAAVKKYLGATKSKLVSSQSIEDTDVAAPASQVATLRSSGAKVLIAATTGSQCVSLMKEVAGQGWKPTFYMSSTCSTTLLDHTARPHCSTTLLDHTARPHCSTTLLDHTARPHCSTTLLGLAGAAANGVS
jgi:ABC-type branched-subunit amino acid transport system substrate-binding protein